MPCYVEKTEVYKNCVLDYSKPEDCRIAVLLSSNGQGKENCEHWKESKFCQCCGQEIKER